MDWGDHDEKIPGEYAQLTKYFEEITRQIPTAVEANLNIPFFIQQSQELPAFSPDRSCEGG